MVLTSGKNKLIVKSFVSGKCYYLDGQYLYPAVKKGNIWELSRNYVIMNNRKLFDIVHNYNKTVTKWKK